MEIFLIVVRDDKAVNKGIVSSSSFNSGLEIGKGIEENRTTRGKKEDVISENVCEGAGPIMSGPAPKQDFRREPYLLGEAAKSGLLLLVLFCTVIFLMKQYCNYKHTHEIFILKYSNVPEVRSQTMGRDPYDHLQIFP